MNRYKIIMFFSVASLYASEQPGIRIQPIEQTPADPSIMQILASMFGFWGNSGGDHSESSATHVRQRFEFKKGKMSARALPGGVPRRVQELITTVRDFERFHRVLGVQELPNGLLMFGPSGNGKSTLAEVVATELDSFFIQMYASDFITKWQGSGAEAMKDLFLQAGALNRRVVIFIDELDKLLKAHDSGDNSEGEPRRAKAELIKQLNDLRRDGNQNVLVLIACNDFGMIPDEIKGRYRNDTLEVRSPDLAERLAIFEYYFADPRFIIEPNRCHFFAQITNGLSRRTICKALERARIEAGLRGKTSIQENDVLSALRSVTNLRVENIRERQMLIDRYLRRGTEIHAPEDFMTLLLREIENWTAERIEQFVSLAERLAARDTIDHENGANNDENDEADRAQRPLYLDERVLSVACALTQPEGIASPLRKRNLLEYLFKIEGLGLHDELLSTLPVLVLQRAPNATPEQIDGMQHRVREISSNFQEVLEIRIMWESIKRSHLVREALRIPEQERTLNIWDIIDLSIGFGRGRLESTTPLIEILMLETANATAEQICEIVRLGIEIARECGDTRVAFLAACAIKLNPAILDITLRTALLQYLLTEKLNPRDTDSIPALAGLLDDCRVEDIKTIVARAQHMALSNRFNSRDFRIAFYAVRNQPITIAAHRQECIDYLNMRSNSQAAWIHPFTLDFSWQQLEKIFQDGAAYAVRRSEAFNGAHIFISLYNNSLLARNDIHVRKAVWAYLLSTTPHVVRGITTMTQILARKTERFTLAQIERLLTRADGFATRRRPPVIEDRDLYEALFEEYRALEEPIQLPYMTDDFPFKAGFAIHASSRPDRFPTRYEQSPSEMYAHIRTFADRMPFGIPYWPEPTEISALIDIEISRTGLSNHISNDFLDEFSRDYYRRISAFRIHELVSEVVRHHEFDGEINDFDIWVASLELFRFFPQSRQQKNEHYYWSLVDRYSTTPLWAMAHGIVSTLPQRLLRLH